MVHSNDCPVCPLVYLSYKFAACDLIAPAKRTIPPERSMIARRHWHFPGRVLKSRQPSVPETYPTSDEQKTCRSKTCSFFKLGHCEIQIRLPVVKTGQYPEPGTGRNNAGLARQGER